MEGAELEFRFFVLPRQQSGGGGSHCKYSRLELYLPNLGKLNDAHTIPADCLGVVWGCGDGTPQATSI